MMPISDPHDIFFYLHHTLMKDNYNTGKTKEGNIQALIGFMLKSPTSGLQVQTVKPLYYMHNKEIPRFPNKLKVMITSGLRRLISSKEIFPLSQFYFSNAIRILYKRRDI